MFENKKDLANVISILVFCPQDNTFLLVLDDERNDYWLPLMKMDEKISWKDNLQLFKKNLFDYEICSEKLVKIIKIWKQEKEYFHLIFQVTLPKDIKTNCKTQTQIGKVGWYSSTQIVKLKPLLRSLEILEIIGQYKMKLSKGGVQITGEVKPIGSLTEVRESDIFVSPKTFNKQHYIDLLDSAGLTFEEQHSCYEEFFMHTYPCIYMNKVSFKKIISKFQFPGDVECLFNAADVWKRNFLTFQDYLFLLAVMEPQTSHYGHVADIRCQYIFRYYADCEDDKIHYQGFQNMVRDIELAKESEANKVSVEKQFESLSKSLDLKTNSAVSIDQFCSYALDAKIRYTSLLLRFSESRINSQVEICMEPLEHDLKPFAVILSPGGKACDSEYKIAVKTVLVNSKQPPSDTDSMQLIQALMFDVSDTLTKSVAEDLNNLRDTPPNSLDLEAKISELLIALKYFCTKTDQNQSLEGEETEADTKEAYSWGSANLEKLGVTVILMCEQLKTILRSEPRLLEIDSPAYVVGAWKGLVESFGEGKFCQTQTLEGDLHGNYHDLMCFEKALWENGMCLVPGKIVFLGDYVDRGTHGLETIMYLFANKIQNPNKLYLIRGNHEIRDIQKLFTFQRECLIKLGSSLGALVWKAINDVFDVMPLAAVIDHKVFCCHGGIPPPWLCPMISVINSIPCPLYNCERQSPLAWTLMWNDPLKQSSWNSSQDLELLAYEGFVPNVQRGTAYAFSCEALERFLKTNNLSHVIRAHEVVKAGFQIHQKAKLLTVFSSSGYCGGKNYAASVLVADKLLRVFMVDTGIN